MNENNILTEKQKTIGSKFTLSGIGLHTGLKSEITVLPAPENFGIQFQRIDLPNQPFIKAIVDNVSQTNRSTTLEEDGARVMTVEHLLAALAGMQINNALITINAPELPILDGSSKFYVEAIQKAGIVEQNAELEYYELKYPISYKDEEKDIEMIALPNKTFEANVLIDFNYDYFVPQYARLKNIKEFATEIAQCRTFVFFEELEFLSKNNLIKGGDLSNAIVFAPNNLQEKDLEKVCEALNREKIEVKEGILNNIETNFKNEAARHKLLDLIGDISLIGMPLKAKFVARKPGHTANVEMAKLIRAAIKKEKNKPNVPEYNPNKPALYDINKISKILPHKQPFLLVDKIIELTETQVVGIKNVTMNEEFFKGHFPGNPVMPGVLQIEALAQTGGILALSTVPDPENYTTYFLKINNVRFKRKVIPGDTLILKLELTEPIRRGIVQMKAQAFVGEELVTEGDLMAQIVKDK